MVSIRPGTHIGMQQCAVLRSGDGSMRHLDEAQQQRLPSSAAIRQNVQDRWTPFLCTTLNMATCQLADEHATPGSGCCSLLKTRTTSQVHLSALQACHDAGTALAPCISATSRRLVHKTKATRWSYGTVLSLLASITSSCCSSSRCASPPPASCVLTCWVSGTPHVRAYCRAASVQVTLQPTSRTRRYVFERVTPAPPPRLSLASKSC